MLYNSTRLLQTLQIFTKKTLHTQNIHNSTNSTQLHKQAHTHLHKFTTPLNKNMYISKLQTTPQISKQLQAQTKYTFFVKQNFAMLYNTLHNFYKNQTTLSNGLHNFTHKVVQLYVTLQTDFTHIHNFTNLYQKQIQDSTQFFYTSQAFTDLHILKRLKYSTTFFKSSHICSIKHSRILRKTLQHITQFYTFLLNPTQVSQTNAQFYKTLLNKYTISYN